MKRLSSAVMGYMMFLDHRSFRTVYIFYFHDPGAPDRITLSQILSANITQTYCIHRDFFFLSPSKVYILLNHVNHWTRQMTVRPQHGITGSLLTKEFFELWPYSL